MKLSNKKIIIFSLILCAILLIIWRGHIRDQLTLASLREQSAYFLEQVHRHYLFSVLIYMAIYTALIALALPVVAPLTILGGYLFGALYGTLYGVISASTGALIYFLVIRYLFAHTVKERYSQQLAVFHDKMTRYGASYLISLQLLTIIPYFVINTLAALADVPLVTFAWTTVVGGIPLQAIYAFAGRELATLHSIRDILKPTILVILIVMAILAALPVVLRWIQERRHRE